MTNFSSLTHPAWGATHALARPLAALGLLLATAGAAQAQALPPAPASARAAVPEASGYSILYQLDLPNAANFNSAGVPYSINNSGAVLANPARVAYYLELTNGTTTTYVWTSMANFATTLTQLGIPNPTSNNVSLHQSVSSLNVFSNVAGVTTGTNLGTGRIEMWPTNYATDNSDAVPGASGNTYDFGDRPDANNNYGSFQVHNLTAGQTVFAYNNWGSNGDGGGIGNLGIGNQVGGSGQPDWTFQYNANQYSVKRLTILINTPANNALAFDGTNDYVSLPASTPVPVGNSAYTIEAWIKPTSMGVYGIAGWGNYGTQNQTNAFRLDPSNGGQLVNYWWANDLTVQVGDLSGKWHHVAATFDGTTRRIYLDGVLKGSDTPSGHNVPNASNLRLGSTCPGPCNGEYFPGSLDEVRIYSVGLTQAQVQADMFSASGTAAVPASQKYYANFDQGTAGGTNAGVTSLTDQSGNGSTGTLANFGLTGTSSNWVRSFPTITGISPVSGPVGTSVGIMGTNLADATSFAFNGTNASGLAVANDFSATATVPGGATTGLVSLAASALTRYAGPLFTLAYSDLTVNTAGQTIPAGIYNNITVASGGVGTPNGDVTVNTGLTVQSGGTLNDGCAIIGGAGSFALAAGGTLGICNAAGITSSGATGAIQTTGTRSFSIDASYVYNGSATQNTGNGLPAQVRNLSTTNASTVTLTAPTSATQVVTVGAAGNLALNGNTLTLLSSSTGTALVVNSGTGIVSGNTATVQRYIDGSLNSGAGYRHYGVPVSGSTLADFTTSGYTPVLNPAYNSSATPATVTPFPTLFVYNQSVLATANNNLSAFDKGWLSPGSLSNGLTPGIGYAVNIGAGQVVDFVGTLYNSANQVSMLRTTGTTAADGGWALLGNPYPAPLNLSLVDPADRTNLDAAIYVVQSTGQYAGGYRAYVNGMSTSPSNSPLLALGQGFFARVSAGQTNGSFTFRNAQRVTTYATQAAFQRTTADPRPAVRLELAGAGLADGWVAYAENGATPGFDSELDATKLPNSTGLNLSSAVGADNLAIDGRPVFEAATVLPLAVGVPAAGTYTLSATALNSLPAGLNAYLLDSQTGQSVLLAAGTSYSFGVTAAQAATLLTGRFAVVFRPQSPLATVAALAATDVTVYPNPAHASFTVTLPGVAGASTVQAELLNTLGQVVRRQAAALPTAGTALTISTTELAAGVYVLRLQAGATTLAKRIVVQ